MKFKELLSGLSMLVAITAITITLPAQAELAHDYDWVIRIETEHFRDFLAYRNSGIKDAVKAKVTYLQKGNPESARVLYETFYYHKLRPLAQERHTHFGVAQGEQVAIEIKHKSEPADEDEKLAASNAALRVALEAMLNKTMVTVVKVPTGSFSSIRNALEAQGFSSHPTEDADMPITNAVNLFLTTGPSGQKANLYYGE